MQTLDLSNPMSQAPNMGSTQPQMKQQQQQQQQQQPTPQSQAPSDTTSPYPFNYVFPSDIPTIPDMGGDIDMDWAAWDDLIADSRLEGYGLEGNMAPLGFGFGG